jgi:hypothetical protein
MGIMMMMMMMMMMMGEELVMRNKAKGQGWGYRYANPLLHSNYDKWMTEERKEKR